MHLPLSLGTILQNRYFLIDLLGQGKSGRTYLAKDQGRENEFCVLKEFIPETTPSIPLQQFADRLREEAFTLFRIRHPQIPQFRATFEQDGRLFLVREYVEGKTYSRLLSLRQNSASLPASDRADEESIVEKTEGSTHSEPAAFSEEEILQWLQQLLPVLDYLHALGIDHGNLSPDNIIRRERPAETLAEGEEVYESFFQQPVLIDFAIEKQLASHLTPEAIAKDKSEQSERSPHSPYFPSNDLYALALTAVILLTARDPQELFENNQLRHDWQQWTTVSSELAGILNRMLSANPEDRYPSAREIAVALQSLNAFTSESRKPTRQRQAWNYTGAYALSLGLVLVVSFGSWAVLNYMLNPTQPPLPILPGSDQASSKSSTSTTNAPSTKPITSSKPLNLEPNQTTTVKGNLRANEILTYIIRGQKGQQLNASVSGKGVLMNVFNPNHKPIHDRNKPVRSWKGGLFASGDYYIQLRPVKGSDKNEYQLDAKLAEYFPQKVCEEPNGGGSGTWYPVLVEYSPQMLNRVQSQYCRDTFLAPSSSAESPSLQIAAFGDRFQAEAFAKLIDSEIGSGKVGEPITGNHPPRSCSDRAVGDNQTWYPIFVEYTKQKYVQILSYCPDATVTKRPNRNGSYIKVAAFLDKSKAAQVAYLLAQAVGSAEVGEAMTLSAQEAKSGN